MKVHDLTAETVADAMRMGFDDVDFDDLVAMRVHDIDAEFVREVDALGFGPLAEPSRQVWTRRHRAPPLLLS